MHLECIHRAGAKRSEKNDLTMAAHAHTHTHTLTHSYKDTKDGAAGTHHTHKHRSQIIPDTNKNHNLQNNPTKKQPKKSKHHETVLYRCTHTETYRNTTHKTNRHKHTHAETHTQTKTYRQKRKRRQTHTHTQTQRHTQTHRHTHTQTHTHTHTHTHTQREREREKRGNKKGRSLKVYKLCLHLT